MTAIDKAAAVAPVEKFEKESKRAGDKIIHKEPSKRKKIKKQGKTKRELDYDADPLDPGTSSNSNQPPQMNFSGSKDFGAPKVGTPRDCITSGSKDVVAGDAASGPKSVEPKALILVEDQDPSEDGEEDDDIELKHQIRLQQAWRKNAYDIGFENTKELMLSQKGRKKTLSDEEVETLALDVIILLSQMIVDRITLRVFQLLTNHQEEVDAQYNADKDVSENIQRQVHRIKDF